MRLALPSTAAAAVDRPGGDQPQRHASWLVAAEAFRLAYPAGPPRPQGGVSHLAGFVFLVITLATFFGTTVSGWRGAQGARRARGCSRKTPSSSPRVSQSRSSPRRCQTTEARHEPPHGRLHAPRHGRRCPPADWRSATTRRRRARSLARDASPRPSSVLLSTCNRVELYAAGDGPADAPDDRRAGRRHAQLPRRARRSESQARSMTLDRPRRGRPPVRVAASLDSMVVGEPQILAQVKQAYELADERGATGPLTARRFQAAPARRPARRQRNDHPPAPREHSQRRGRRFRPADLRAVRRQARRW